ncbi:MAG: signal recognition particle-docking protein FtsY, partial [Spirochaetia bacterium]
LIRRLLSEHIKTAELTPEENKTNVVLILGVNGVGKTTTIAKMANYFRVNRKMESVLAAADTFRAAAIDQLQEHGRRLNLRVVSQKPGSDPGAVIYDALESVQARGEPIIIADTAGRMHTKKNLVKELQKIDKIITSRVREGNYYKLMVIDATTGQNALHQAEMFHEAIGIDGMILAKYDSASKGGIAVSISQNLGIPFMFMGTGEKYEDIEPFDVDRYLDVLIGDI